MEMLNRKLMNWASILEEGTREQAVTTSGMPFIHPHLALMPDAHLGKGATVGSVIPTVGAIMPAAVGVDIGCGMMAVRTDIQFDDITSPLDRTDIFEDDDYFRLLRELHTDILARVPVSAGGYNTEVSETAGLRVAELEGMAGIEQAEGVKGDWRKQLGTLGSGNHFIEVSTDENDNVWLFLHSGSRGVGNQLASKHIRVAQEQCAKRYIPLPDRDLAYLVEGDPEFWAYMEALRWAQRFAFLNREEMMDRVVAAFEQFVGGRINRLETVNCHHNYTVQEEHFGKKVWLSRKGAIDAHEGVMGLIPGSMGDKSYVVRGLGNKLALSSSPHGAGRNHSRAAAKRQFTRADLDERMAGRVWGNSDAFLDEHPQAYKPIDQVMEDAGDLVEIVHTLHQFVNVKGA